MCPKGAFNSGGKREHIPQKVNIHPRQCGLRPEGEAWLYSRETKFPTCALGN